MGARARQIRTPAKLGLPQKLFPMPALQAAAVAVKRMSVVCQNCPRQRLTSIPPKEKKMWAEIEQQTEMELKVDL